MSDSLLELISELDENEDAHLARLLVLLNAFHKEDTASVEGITKLVKLDFLLRYPAYFEAAMIARGVASSRLNLADFERDTIETKMVRYRYGPWDHRYRRFLNTLAAKGLVTLSIKGRRISIDLTEKGRGLSACLLNKDEFEVLGKRAKLLSERLDIGATKLMNFIYETFPELHAMQFNQEIDAQGLLR